MSSYIDADGRCVKMLYIVTKVGKRRKHGFGVYPLKGFYSREPPPPLVVFPTQEEAQRYVDVLNRMEDG